MKNIRCSSAPKQSATDSSKQPRTENIAPISKQVLNSPQNPEKLRVVIRIRPPLPREIDQNVSFRSIAIVSKDNKNCSLVEYLGIQEDEVNRQIEWIESPHFFQLHNFSYDYVFPIESTQEEVYQYTGKPAVKSLIEGYNATILAYGQTGTGKTFTMEGFAFDEIDEKRGIVPRSVEEIFLEISNFTRSSTKFAIKASYCQIYNESISDLLKEDRNNLQIREDKKRGVYVDGLSEWSVKQPSDIYTLLENGSSLRATSSTKMNDVSSRSHAVFIITLEQVVSNTNKSDNTIELTPKIKISKLNLVDLAGSERIKNTGASGKQLEESKKINKSLSALGNVINALTDPKNRTHIPYRDSKLTRLLEDSLGGNCKTTMIATISPSHEFFSETMSTLQFARRAKNIKTTPIINEEIDQISIIKDYELEIARLRKELESKSQYINKDEILEKLEEKRKMAEIDRNEAIEALERATNKYFEVKNEKKNLEEKFKKLSLKLNENQGRRNVNYDSKNTENYEENLLYKELEMKIKEIEGERQTLDEEKSQIERYKQLLLDQRDIMLTLTDKLNDRDEAILQMQEEIESNLKYKEKLHKYIEKLKRKNSQFLKIIRQNNLQLEDNIELSDNDISRSIRTESNQSPVKIKINQGKEIDVLRRDSSQKKLQLLEMSPEKSRKFETEILDLRKIISYRDKLLNENKIQIQSIYNEYENLFRKLESNRKNILNISKKSTELKEFIQTFIKFIPNENLQEVFSIIDFLKKTSSELNGNLSSPILKKIESFNNFMSNSLIEMNNTIDHDDRGIYRNDSFNKVKDNGLSSNSTQDIYFKNRVLTPIKSNKNSNLENEIATESSKRSKGIKNSMSNYTNEGVVLENELSEFRIERREKKGTINNDKVHHHSNSNYNGVKKGDLNKFLNCK